MGRLSKLSVALSSLGLTKAAADVTDLESQDDIYDLLSGSRHFYNVDNFEFFNDNIADLNRINKLAEGNFRLIGEGAEGVAFAIGKQRSGEEPYVLKVTFEPINDYPDKDNKRTKDTVWEEYSGASHEVVIHSSGTFRIKNFDSQVSSIAWWKIIEKTNTNPLRKKDIEPLIQLILRYIKNFAMAKAESEAKTEFEKEEIRNQPIESADIMSPESATILDADKAGTRSGLSKRISGLILSSGIDRDIIEYYNDALEPGWLEDFIDGILYQMAVRNKADFGPKNLGIRESTGRLVWFDA